MIGAKALEKQKPRLFFFFFFVKAKIICISTVKILQIFWGPKNTSIQYSVFFFKFLAVVAKNVFTNLF